MKNILNILFILFLTVLMFPKQFVAQESNIRLKPTNRAEPESLQRLLHIADSIGSDSLILSINDIYIDPNGNSFVDLYHVVQVRLYSQSTDVSAPAFNQSLELDLSIEFGGDASGGGAYALLESATLEINPKKDISSSTFYFAKGNGIAPYNPVQLKTVRIAVAKSELIEVVSEAFLKDLFLEVYVDRGRYFDPTNTNIQIFPQIYGYNISNVNNDLKENEAVIKWSTVKGPASYEIEWVHIPVNYVSGNKIKYDFRKNAIRLSTDKDFVPLSLIHDNGYIAVRGRTKRPALNKDETAITDQYIYSEWSLGSIGDTLSLSNPAVIAINNLNSDEIRSINWQYTSNYANEGKKKEIINFFDGSNRSRQTNTLLYDHSGSTSIDLNKEVKNQSTVISKESYYDFNGSPIINLLPTPIVEATDVGYQKGINKLSTEKISKWDYDSIGYETLPAFTNSGAGASQYYSVQNQLLGSDLKADYIPDAEGYPYQKLEYLKDGSGRLKIERGVGKEKATIDSKGTQYGYARPTSVELERLFGSNVGEAAFYKKEIVVDPNGVTNIAYKDIKGRTVATAIAGEAEGRSGLLPIAIESEALTENLLRTGAEEFLEQEGAYELSYPIYVPVTSTYRFNYKFDIDPFIPCTNGSVCYDCMYELTFQIIDENNQLVLEAKDSMVEFHESSCITENYTLDNLKYVHPDYLNTSKEYMSRNDSIIVTLSGRKQYTILKRLEVKTDSLEIDAGAFLADNGCGLLDLEYFENEELNNIDYSGCEKNYLIEEPNFCSDLYEDLRSDFLLPNGHFVSGALDGDFFGRIFDKLENTLGCGRLSPSGCYGDRAAFISDLMNQFYGGHGNYQVFTEKSQQIADFLVEYHPNYCQYIICQRKYEANKTFDKIIAKSKNLDEFVAMGAKKNFFDEDTLNFFWNQLDSMFSVEDTGGNFTYSVEELLYRFDPMMKFDSISNTDSIETYKLCSDYEDDGVGYYSHIAFNEFVRECTPDIPIFNRELWYMIYFQNLMNGCDTGAQQITLYDVVKTAARREADMIVEDDEDIDPKWQVFKGMYKKIRDVLMEDMISSLICVNPSAYQVDLHCSTPITSPTNGGEDTLHRGCLLVNLACSSKVGEYFINTPYARAVPRHKKYKQEFDDIIEESTIDFSDPAVETIDIDSLVGSQVFQLLKATTIPCISMTPSDTLNFLSNFNAELFVCDPFQYLKTTFTTYITCSNLEFWSNLATVQIEFMKMKRDSSGILVSRFTCSPPKDYTVTYMDFQIQHQKYLTNYSNQVPPVPSLADVDIFNPIQKQYVNVMNTYLRLNLSMADYFKFVNEFTDEGTLHAFNGVASWKGSSRAKEIKKAVIRDAKSVSPTDLRSLMPALLYNKVNNHLGALGYAHIATDSYLGFGEESLDAGQFDLYYLAHGATSYSTVLDTFNRVLKTVKDSAGGLQLVDGSAFVNTSRASIKQYTAVNGLNDLLIDRALVYSNGTVWVRLLSASDSSYYDDYHYYYEPNTLFYDIGDIPPADSVNAMPFESIAPIFDQEEMHYVKLGFTFNHQQYEMIAKKSSVVANAERIIRVELNDQFGMPAYPMDESCEDFLYSNAIIVAKKKFSDYRGNITDGFKLDYTNYCRSNLSNKSISNREMSMSYTAPERHFTLYYYDQADNLVMTVPPEGVRLLTNVMDTTDDIEAYRNGTGPEVLPAHTKKTIYKYNSDNQIIEQTTPNGGTSYFWYDKVGRLVLSQNAEQLLGNRYSYTRYDEQSRINETGEAVLIDISGKTWEEIHAFIALDILDAVPLTLDDFIASTIRNNVVRTYYDTTVLLAPALLSQQNLRSRVSTVAYYDLYSSTSLNTDWKYATHYDYDVTGNVKTILNDYYQNGRINNPQHRFKRIDYAYDVVSGNVEQVYYQTGESDAFYHRYEYDAENRITQVETSRDGILWDKDATYSYYLHGPLARTELGDNKVQGMDYAYTLEGWLKSINSGHQFADMGNDNKKNNVFGEDAFGMALQYNQYDYQSIASGANFLVAGNTGDGNTDLYNGNISAISQHNQQMTYGKTYRYDQLNRLRSMTEKTIDEDDLLWGGDLLKGNASFYEYDADGNLLELSRLDGASGLLMDELKYNYALGTDKLISVDDTVAIAAFPNDIDQQDPNNYSYDEIGNLKSDKSEGIYQIQWYPNGKVKRIVRDSASKQQPNLKFEYDAMGNRIRKTVSFTENNIFTLRSTYYVRDAQGNIMATYEERDCDYLAAKDSLGVYHYQYSGDFGFYTQAAVDSVGLSAVMSYLSGSFPHSAVLEQEACNLLSQLPGIKDTIIEDMDISNYFTLYPGAKSTILSADPYFYATYMMGNNLNSFIGLMNQENEAYLQYHYNNSQSVIDFYDMVLDYYYSMVYDNNSNAENYFLMNKAVVEELLFDDGFIRSLTEITSSDYNIIHAFINGDPASINRPLAITEVNDWLINLESNLDNGNFGAPTPNLIDKIHAALLMVDYDSSDMIDLFNGVNVGDIMGALGNAPASISEKLNTLLYNVSFVNSQLVPQAYLMPYKPSAAFKWSIADRYGYLLKYFIHTDADTIITNALTPYLNGLNISTPDIYFTNSNAVRGFVDDALQENKDDATVTNALITNDVVTKSILKNTQNVNQLTIYYKVYYPELVLTQSFYHDGLNNAFGGIFNLTALDYAALLEANLNGLSFGALGGCDPHQISMVAEQFTIFGSKRLGVMDAKKKRKDADNLYSRKLRAKNYELSDHLGNVVATVSDKKMHPQELLAPDENAVDTALGFQADVTGRYDYYPFGMEIMSRSGDFTTVDYTTDNTKLIYSGLFDKCSRYNGGTPACVTAQNIYGQDYVISMRIESGSLLHFDFDIDLNISKFIPELKLESTYKIELAVNAEGRLVYGVTPKVGTLSSESAGAGASDYEKQIAVDKSVTLEFTGKELDSLATNGIINLLYEAHTAPHQGYGTTYIDVNYFKIFEVNENTTTPIAMRNGSVYPYGFNGMEREAGSVDVSAPLYTESFESGFESRVIYAEDFDPTNDFTFCSGSLVLKGAEVAYEVSPTSSSCGAVSEPFIAEKGTDYNLTADLEKVLAGLEKMYFYWEYYDPAIDGDWGVQKKIDVSAGRQTYTFTEEAKSSLMRLRVVGDAVSYGTVLGYAYSISVEKESGNEWSITNRTSDGEPNAFSDDGRLLLQNNENDKGAESKEITVKHKGQPHTITFDAEKENLTTHSAWVVVHQKDAGGSWSVINESAYSRTALGSEQVKKTFTPTKDFIRVKIYSKGTAAFSSPMEFYVDNLVISDGQENLTASVSGGYTTEFRQYDSRLGQWLSRDPLAAKFPWQSPYVAFDNNPISFTDPKGLAAGGGEKEGKEGGNESVKTIEGPVKLNDSKVPEGPYLSAKLDIKTGPHTKEGITILGMGEKIEAGASLEIASAEIVVSMDGAWLNLSLMNSTDVDMTIGGTHIAVGGSVTVTKNISTGEITNEASAQVGPATLTFSENSLPVLSLSIIDASKTMMAAGIPFSVSLSINVENLQFNNMQEGSATDGLKQSYRQSYGWSQGQKYRLQQQAQERKKKKLTNNLNNLFGQ